AQEDHEAERIAREQKIRGLEEELNGCQGRRKTTEHEVEQFRAAVTKYKEEGYRLSNMEKEVRHTLEEKKNQLRNLQDARSDRLKRFGAWVPTLLEKIEVAHRQNRFHQKPRGPLGACIQLKDPSCALGVECCLKNLMHSYCCTDYHDEKILNQIMTQVCPKGRPKPTIIVSRFLEHVHDVSQFRSRCEFPTVLDMLELDDPVVANALVDQRGIENVILIKNAVQARQFMGKNKDRNTKEVQPSNQSAEGAKDMRALSGGERSFSTVCFILALWDAMESPFRCMDEFDVYMDMVNRRISMDMLMEVAKNQKTRQFIFLTPQNMSNLQPSPTLKIFKMPDPQRGSGVIETTREQEEEQEAMAT
ncbi:structural maintenance of chromosomes protein 6-like, partial [Lingula anatina]|uniref:Structural maintenance of chromosomes protein 6-like n=1 Tax=Lingula anatina TaxID=7574 RepID=A0A2R2MU09_LINAN